MLKQCLHCEAKADNLEVQIVLIAVVDEKGIVEQEPEERKFVYCTNCGHYGDLDTWNNRP